MASNNSKSNAQLNRSGYRTKILSTTETNTVANIADLNFTGLVPGETYTVVLTAFFRSQAGAASVEVMHDSDCVIQAYLDTDTSASYVTGQFSIESPPFVATGTDITVATVNFNTNQDFLYGDGTTCRTHVTVYKHKDLVEDLSL